MSEINLDLTPVSGETEMSVMIGDTSISFPIFPLWEKLGETKSDPENAEEYNNEVKLLFEEYLGQHSGSSISLNMWQSKMIYDTIFKYVTQLFKKKLTQ